MADRFMVIFAVAHVSADVAPVTANWKPQVCVRLFLVWLPFPAEVPLRALSGSVPLLWSCLPNHNYVTWHLVLIENSPYLQAERVAAVGRNALLPS